MAAGGDKKNEGELGAHSLRSLRRCVRLATIKEAATSEQSEILRLKREAKDLMKRTPEEEAEIRRLEREADALMNRTAAAEEEPQPQPAAGNKRRRTVIKKTLEVREMYFRRKAIADNFLEYQRALIKQFRKKGYAEDYTEVEVTDGEDN
nr:unnamed protein product [Digitaria exilis]